MSTNKKHYNVGSIVQILGRITSFDIDDDEGCLGGVFYSVDILSATNLGSTQCGDCISIDHDEIVGVVSQSAIDKIKNKQKNDRLKEIETQMASLKKEADKIKAEMKPKAAPKAVKGK